MRWLAFGLGVALAVAALPCQAQTQEPAATAAPVAPQPHQWVEHWNNNKGQLMMRTCHISAGQKRCGKAKRAVAEAPPSN